MRHLWATLLACVLLTPPAAADLVVMRDGTVHQGVVRQHGDRVMIQTSTGMVEVSAADVLRIAEGPAAPAAPGPAAAPSTAPAGGGRPAQALDVEGIDRPEPYVFIYMRMLASTPAGEQSYELRRQIEKWRFDAHDRKRRLGSEWLSPQDFTRRRATFDGYLAEAEAMLRKAKSSKDPERGQQEKLAQAKLRQAALVWPDALIRNFLLGVAYLNERDPKVALTFFTNCRSQAPAVGAFRQGLGLTLLELDQPLEALAEFTELLKLAPESGLALELVRSTMKKVPGTDTKSATYVAAMKLANEYEQPDRTYASSPGVTKWLMPGKEWLAKDKLLPSPAYDRLVFRQAVGVPIGKVTLLVDASAVEGAQEVFVRTEDGLLLPGRVRRFSSSYDKVKLPPLACVSVTGYEFAPLTVDKAAAFQEKTPVTVMAMDLYQQMAKTPRRMPARIESVADGLASLSARLAPGESAGPAVTEDGRLVGVLAGRTDAAADDGGPDQLIGIGAIAALVDRVRNYGIYSGYGNYGRARRKPAEPQPVKGVFFVVLVAASERLDK